MDKQVLKAMAKWPSVPALFGWLKLDRRGRWLLQGESIGRPQLTEFIARNYNVDEQGRWFFQNGPQRVFVSLEYMPLVLRAQGDVLSTQTGQVLARPRAAYLDEHGALLVVGEHGPALLADADLPWAFERLVLRGRDSLNEADLEQALALPSGSRTAMCLELCSQTLPLGRLDATRAPEALGFQREPAPSPESV